MTQCAKKRGYTMRIYAIRNASVSYSAPIKNQRVRRFDSPKEQTPPTRQVSFKDKAESGAVLTALATAAATVFMTGGAATPAAVALFSSAGALSGGMLGHIMDKADQEYKSASY